jgi:hypothetical protein
MTPEGKIKRKIREVFNKYKSHGIYVYMPVPGGYGKSSLDYLGFICGLGFAVEAKAPDKKPRPRQLGTIERIEESGVPVFVVDDDATLAKLDRWLTTVVERNSDGRVHPYSGHGPGQYL